MKSGYEVELQNLKPWDEVQTMEYNPKDKGYPFITTAGHGYLVVRRDDLYADRAAKICEYGFTGKKAFYLEEDCEAGKFLQTI